MNENGQQPLLEGELALALEAQLMKHVHLGGVLGPAVDGFLLLVIGIHRLGVVEVSRDLQAPVSKNLTNDR